MSNGNRASSKASGGKSNGKTTAKRIVPTSGKKAGLQRGYERAANGKVQKARKPVPKPIAESEAGKLPEKNVRKKNVHVPYVVRDEFFYEAKKRGYRARSAFKLKELQELFSLISPGDAVLDIASAPGSFLQVIHEILGNGSKMMGVDIQKIAGLGYPNLKLVQADIFDYATIEREITDYGVDRFDVITSDIAPSTTGMTGVDQYRSVELNLAILDVAKRFLRPGGNMILKVFVGEDVDDLVWPARAMFQTLRRHKPRACRDRSFEEYFVCLGMK